MTFSLLPKILDPEKDKEAYKSVEELDSVLNSAEKDGIRNIALTGPYGSGKSSILRTIQKDFASNRHYLPISLATLQSDDDIDVPDADSQANMQRNELLNRKIEYSILQQLIYREESSTVPSSRFKRIVHFTKKELKILSLATIVFVICFFVVFEPSFAKVDTLCELFNWGLLNAWVDVLATVYMLWCLYRVARYVIQAYSNSKLNKLNLKDGEIDLQEDTSIFNKHLDEILYFFRATPYNIILIEDLDRFKTTDIYLKLRELNQLINECKEIKRHIVFVYAAKDDIFKDEDRTKFFDYIITVIPVINPYNSKTILKEKLLESGLQDGQISDDDLSGMAFFIQEMRILTNIVNEFTQYRERIVQENNNLDLTKLLGIIVYKNYYPKDFASLHRREGKVYKCIAHKRDFIKIAVDELESKLKKLHERREEIINSSKLSVSELRRLFILDLTDTIHYKSLESIEIDGQYHSPWNIAKDDLLFQKFIGLKQLHYKYHNYNYGRITDISENINITARYNTSEYKKRIDFIVSDELAVIDDDISKIESEKTRTSTFLLSKLLAYKSVRNNDIFTNIHLSELMEVFLIEGYIDENYYDYISYFYPGMISPADRSYLIGIKRLMPSIFEQHIDKIDNFVKELMPVNFTSDSILNVELLDFLIVNKNDNDRLQSFYKMMMEQIVSSSINFGFLNKYYTLSNNPKSVFAEILTKSQKEVWDKIFDFSEEDVRRNLINATLRFGGILKSPIIEWCSSNYAYIQSNKNELESERLDYIVEECIFEELIEGDNTLLGNVISHDSYIITENNLLIILKTIYSQTGQYNIDYLSFDLVINCGREEVSSYLLSEENLQETFDSIKKSGSKSESLESIDFIVLSNLSTDDKKSYLLGQNNRRPNIDGLNDEQAKILYQCNIVEATWANVGVLFSKFQNEDNITIKYILENKQMLINTNSASGIEQECELYDFLFGNNEALTFEDYVGLECAFECTMDGEAYLPKLDCGRFKHDLEHGKISFCKENIDLLKSSNNYVIYLIYHKDKFLQNLELEYSFSIDEAIALLSSTSFTWHEKMNVLKIVNISAIIHSEKLASITAEIIAADVSKSPFSHSELRAIVEQSNNLQSNVKIVTYLLNDYEYSCSDIEEILSTLKTEEYQLLSERHKKPKFANDPHTKSLFKALEKRGFISSITESDNTLRPNYFRDK